MGLTLHRGPAFGGGHRAAREAWRAHGGLLVLRDRAATTAALAESAGADGAVQGREAITLAGLRARVLNAAGWPDTPTPAPVATRIALGELVAGETWPGFGASAAGPGFLGALERALTELRAARVSPDAVRAAAAAGPEADLARLYQRAEGVALPVDREWRAADAAAGLAAFAPVALDGLDDLAPPAWALLRALGRVTEVLVSLAYEPGRRAYAARDARQARWAAEADAVRDHRAASASGRSPALAALDAGLFEDRMGGGPEARGDGAVRWVGAAGTRGMHRAALEEVLGAHRAGVPLAEIALAVPRLAEARDDLDRLLADWGVPARRVTRMRVMEAPIVPALLNLLALGERDRAAPGALDPLLAWLRSPYADADPAEVDRFEVDMRRAAGAGGSEAPPLGRRSTLLRRWDRAAIAPAIRLTGAARSGPRAQLAVLVAVGWEALRARADGAPATAADRRDQAALDALAGLASGLARREEAGEPEDGRGEDRRTRGPLPPGALGRLIADLSFADAEGPADGLLVTDLAGLRGHRCRVVVLAGLDGQGVPAAPAPDPFLASLRARLPALAPRAAGTDESRLRFLQAVAAARERLVLVRRTVDDDGRELAPSPYWAETLRLCGRPLTHLDRTTGAQGELVADVAGAPSAHEALRRLAADGHTAPGPLAGALARRARPRGLPSAPFSGRERFRVTELEGYLTCPYGWLHGAIGPRSIAEDFDVAAEGRLAHRALHLLFARVTEAGGGRCDADGLAAYLAALPDALADAIAEHRPPEAGRPFEAFRIRIGRHLADLVRREAAAGPRWDTVALEVRLVDRVLLAGLAPPAVLSGQADRIDASPDGRLAMAIDYKRSGASFDPAATDVRERLQLPLYAEAAARAAGGGRESAGGLYVGITKTAASGALRDDADAFWAPPGTAITAAGWRAVVADAVTAAESAVTGIRAGRLGPPPADCPPWCGHPDLWR